MERSWLLAGLAAALRDAAFLYWAWLGQATVMEPRHASLSAAALDDIARLFEARPFRRTWLKPK